MIPLDNMPDVVNCSNAQKRLDVRYMKSTLFAFSNIYVITPKIGKMTLCHRRYCADDIDECRILEIEIVMMVRDEDALGIGL